MITATPTKTRMSGEANDASTFLLSHTRDRAIRKYCALRSPAVGDRQMCRTSSHELEVRFEWDAAWRNAGIMPTLSVNPFTHLFLVGRRDRLILSASHALPAGQMQDPHMSSNMTSFLQRPSPLISIDSSRLLASPLVLNLVPPRRPYFSVFTSASATICAYRSSVFSLSMMPLSLFYLSFCLFFLWSSLMSPLMLTSSLFVSVAEGGLVWPAIAWRPAMTGHCAS